MSHPSDEAIPDADQECCQPWLHELELAVHGNVTALSTRDGSMGAPGTGLFVDDRRVLSCLTVLADGREVSHLVSSSRGDQTQVLGSLRHLGAPGPDPTVELRRSRTVQEGGMAETVRVTCRAGEPVRTSLTIDLGGDGAPLADVKLGRACGPLLPAMGAGLGPEEVVLSWSDDRHLTQVTCTPAPTAVRVGDPGEPSTLVVDLEVGPGQSRAVALGVHARRLQASVLDADPGADLVDWSQVRVTAGDSRLGAVVDTSLRDLRHLVMRDPLEPGDVFAAAGSPWYLTLFGRDSLWAARLTLPFGTTLAGGTLRTLARRQGTRDDPTTEEQPGRILHEVRREDCRDERTGEGLPTVYYGTVDATSLWVCLLHDAWLHGLPEDEVRALLPALEAAMGWVGRMVREASCGLLRYVDGTGAGLANQGWKDSGDSMRRADGSVAPAPIALLEAQAYAVEAALGAAALGEALGLAPRTVAGWRALAEDLAGRVRARFWVEGTHGRHLAMALDGDDHPVDGLGSNMGHALGTGLLDGEEARAAARVLTGPDMLGPYGISTLSRANPAYNPIGYHTGSVWTHDTAVALLGLVAEGCTERAGDVARALVDVACAFGMRWPELCSGDPVLGRPAPYPASCRPQAWSAAAAGALVTAVLGLRVDAPGRVVHVRPLDPLPFGPVRVEGLRLGDQAWSVDVDHHGRVTVEGLPDDVRVVVG